MSKNTRWSPEDLKKAGLIEVNGVLVKASSQVAKGPIDKIHLPPDYLTVKQIGFKRPDGSFETPGQALVKAEIARAANPNKPYVHWEQEKKPATNKKIRNAKKSIIDGVQFDSDLEAYMYRLLTGAKINFEFQKTFTLQEKFRYRDENIRAIVKIVDFYLPTRNMIIETKGYASDVSPIKHKMLKKALKLNYLIEPEVIMPKNKRECDLLLNKLLYL